MLEGGIDGGDDFTPSLMPNGDDNGLMFAPSCHPKNDTAQKCFDASNNKICQHQIEQVSLNELGQYVQFPSRWWHRGYYAITSGVMYITAQLFCTAAQDGESWSGHTRTRNQSRREGRITGEGIESFSRDVKDNWETTYSDSLYRPSKAFDGDQIDRTTNRHLQDETFRNIPKMNALVTEFENSNRELRVHSVWLIKKTKENKGFQGWHRDFHLSTNGIIATIVVNVGVYPSVADDDYTLKPPSPAADNSSAGDDKYPQKPPSPAAEESSPTTDEYPQKKQPSQAAYAGVSSSRRKKKTKTVEYNLPKYIGNTGEERRDKDFRFKGEIPPPREKSKRLAKLTPVEDEKMDESKDNGNPGDALKSSSNDVNRTTKMDEKYVTFYPPSHHQPPENDSDNYYDASTSTDSDYNDNDGTTKDSDNYDPVEAAMAQRVSKRLHKFLPPSTAPPYRVRETMFRKPPAGEKPRRKGVRERKDVSEAAGRGKTSKRGG